MMMVSTTLRTAVSFSVRPVASGKVTLPGMSRFERGANWSRGHHRTELSSSSCGFLQTCRFRSIRHQGNRRSYSGVSSLCMMPEGPEVRTLVDQLQGGIGKRLVDIRFLSGRYYQQRPVGFAEFAKTMTPLEATSISQKTDGTDSTIDSILDWNCKGKFIYILLDHGGSRKSDLGDHDEDFQRSIWITLGMTGRFVNESNHLEDPSYGRWVLELVDTEGSSNEDTMTYQDRKPPAIVHKIYYHDKRNFGTVKFSLSKSELEQKLSSLGTDVLALARNRAVVEDSDDPSITIDDDLRTQKIDAQATQDFLALIENLRNPQMNICKFLMDQKKICGVGNYILSEALYRANIDPFCGLDELSTSQRILIFRECQTVAYESYRSQQASTSGTTGYTSVRSLAPFEFTLQVYGQITCPKGNPVVRETNGPHGRTIWYTNQQLFVARHIRDQREQQQQQQSNHPAMTNLNSQFDNDRWTITRKDGVEVRDEQSPRRENNEVSTANLSQSALGEWNLLDALTEPKWKEAIEPYAASSQSFERLQEFLEEEFSTYGRDQIYPPQQAIFSALNFCPLDEVKVVILGQDPYHGPGQSTGLAFSVSKTIAKIPPSLRNIFKELDDDIGGGIHEHGDLEGWAKQGVLLLNTVLTVRRGRANSHQNKGWEDFTDELICILRDQATGETKPNTGGNKNGIVFLLWGGPASKKARRIVDSDAEHVVITTSHPSPLGATKTATPFLTSRCFSRVNEALIEMGKDPIDWYDR